ncbi:MAG: hypothetical protein E6899_10615 [Neisseria sp.]|uniref:Uncharacterized protein n=1 Tax=Neisseria macacae ATCC 33926 TaxID=997348 RepID=A0AA36XLD8_9NEIS|nr:MULTISPECIES: hypothetical protein [Neisseria]EGQ77690.1 hypothetical protein HMPREF9418_0815 [Neisseria macacae ATCC 33926]MDU1535271.1 hypothetical protein [Neisseria sp.]UNV85562.1 hypothetical protein MON40_03310 [Neisseria macacae ATCC 33926]
MPAYFHFSNSPSPFNLHTHQIPFFTHPSLPYSPPLIQQIESLPIPRQPPPRFPYFSDDPNAV